MTVGPLSATSAITHPQLGVGYDFKKQQPVNHPWPGGGGTQMAWPYPSRDTGGWTPVDLEHASAEPGLHVPHVNDALVVGHHAAAVLGIRAGEHDAPVAP